MTNVLVVGAGFAGAVYARELAEAGRRVSVIDKRDHIGGNAFDYLDPNGIRVHKYGPHLFHTNNKPVVDWICRFGEFVPYEHRVSALLSDGRLVDFPVNARTIGALYGVDPCDGAAVLAAVAGNRETRGEIRTAEDFLYSEIGPLITNLFFRPYTKKMWALDLQDMDAAVVKRVGVRTDLEDRYFPGDQYQVLPRDGYGAVFERILDHPNIEINLEVTFEKAMEENYDFICNSMPIDEYYDFQFGELPYRSIRFHNENLPREAAPERSVVNYTDDGKFTRETWWHILPSHDVGKHPYVTRTREEPCDYKENKGERYYPVRTSDDRYGKLYQQYKELASAHPKMKFIGRCGTYQYLDMHQVINQSLEGAKKLLGLPK